MSKTGLKIGFMGTPDFAVGSLRALQNSAHNIVCTYSQPPRPKGRGHQVQKSPVHETANEFDIPVFTPLNFKEQAARDEFSAHDLDIAVVVAYGLLLPEEILNAPKYGCVNIHASLLPRWRGASPIQQAIWAGDVQSGVSIMQMDKGLDTGPVISMKSTPITGKTTSLSLHNKLCKIGSDMIVEVLDRLAETRALSSTPQDDSQTTYAPLLKKENGKIDWSQSASQIDCQIRALNPWPGVFSELNGKRFKILEATLTSQTSDQPTGTILDRQGHVVCDENTVLHLLKIQPHGSKAMDFASAINGNHISVGDILT